MALLHPQAANYFLNGKRPGLIGNPHPNIAPYEKYATRTCEIFIAVGNDGQFRKLADLIGRPDLAADARFLTNADRTGHRSELAQELAGVFAHEDGEVLALRLARTGLPAGPVRAIDQAAAAEHTKVRAMVARLGAFRAIGTPIKLSRTPGGLRHPPPRFAADTDSVLRRHGYSDTEQAALVAAGAVATKRRI
jgi:formyl-CoA transferase